MKYRSLVAALVVIFVVKTASAESSGQNAVHEYRLLTQEINTAANELRGTDKTPDLMRWGERLLALVEKYPDDKNLQGMSPAYTIYTYLYLMWEMKPEDEAALLQKMKRSRNEYVRKLVAPRENLLAMRINPAQFRFTALDGSEVDFARLRGKVVLVDAWSIRCSSCVKALPEIRKLRDKYREHGLEVISITFIHDSKTQGKKTFEVLADNQVDWPTWIIRDDAAKAFWDTYGLMGEPATWVLNREGRLASSRGLYGELMERELRWHLGLPPLPAQDKKEAMAAVE